MTMKFLLHKDKEENMENATAQMAHLVFADTQATAKKTKRAIFCQRTDGQLDNYSNIFYLEKRDIKK